MLGARVKYLGLPYMNPSIICMNNRTIEHVFFQDHTSHAITEILAYIQDCSNTFVSWEVDSNILSTKNSDLYNILYINITGVGYS